MDGETGGDRIDTTTSTPVLEAFKAVTVRDKSSPLSISDARVDLALDVPIEAPVLMSSDHFAWYRFNISLSEFCNSGALAARGWWSDGKKSYEIVLKTNTWTHMRLHPPTPNKVDILVVGPYSFVQQYLDFQHGDCKFNTNRGSQCGYCISQPLTLGPLTCVTGASEPQRVGRVLPYTSHPLTKASSPTRHATSKTT